MKPENLIRKSIKPTLYLYWPSIDSISKKPWTSI